MCAMWESGHSEVFRARLVSVLCIIWGQTLQKTTSQGPSLRVSDSAVVIFGEKQLSDGNCKRGIQHVPSACFLFISKDLTLPPTLNPAKRALVMFLLLQGTMSQKDIAVLVKVTTPPPLI